MSSPNLKHLRIKEADGIAVVEFVGSQLMFQSQVVDEVGEELESLVNDLGYTRIVLDFSDVQYMSSSMIAKLAHLERRVEQVKGRLKLCGLGPVLQDTFRIAHLERLFDIYGDAASASKSHW